MSEHDFHKWMTEQGIEDDDIAFKVSRLVECRIPWELQLTFDKSVKDKEYVEDVTIVCDKDPSDDTYSNGRVIVNQQYLLFGLEMFRFLQLVMQEQKDAEFSDQCEKFLLMPGVVGNDIEVVKDGPELSTRPLKRGTVRE